MKRFAILLAASALATPAFAADVITEEPPAPAPIEAAPATWTGFYIGVQGGGAFDPSDPDKQSIDTSFGGPVLVGGVPAFGANSSSSSDASFIGGGHVGYDYQIGSFVVGALADINALDYSEKVGDVASTGAFYNSERSLDYLATGRLRAGYLVTPSALVYGTGGVAYGNVDYDFATSSGFASGASTDSDEDKFGFTVGGGAEVKITDQVSFGAEYLYTNLGNGNSDTTFTTGPFAGGVGGTTTFSQKDDFDFHTVTAKVSYKFN